MRLAHGVPVGGDLDYLDEGTFAAAIKQRTLFWVVYSLIESNQRLVIVGCPAFNFAFTHRKRTFAVQQPMSVLGQKGQALSFDYRRGSEIHRI